MLMAISAAPLLFVTGCGPKFACSSDVYNGDPRCGSVSDTYNTKMRGMEDTGSKKKDTKAWAKQDLVPKPNSTPDPGVEVVRNMNFSAKQAVRVAPKVIRIWIAPWEDSDGDLNQTGYVYSEINDKRGRWLFGEKESTGSQPMLKPVERVAMDPEELKQAQGQEKPQKAAPVPSGDKEQMLKLK